MVKLERKVKQYVAGHEPKLGSVREKNPERNAEIVRHRQAGEWPTEIAKALGVTRNVVIGVLNRAGLCSSDTDRSEVLKKYAPKGEANASAKLTASEVRAIRREYKPCDRVFGARALARQYGVERQCVQNILAGKTWRSVA